MAQRGWMSSRPRMGLQDAYEIASPEHDDNYDYRPRTAPETETPQIIKDWFARAESEERSIFQSERNNGNDAIMSGANTQHMEQPPLDLTGSTWSVGVRDHSPTPRQPATTYEDMRARLDTRSAPPPRLSSTYEERRALLKRIANNPRPAFKPYVKPKSIFERYRRDNPLQPIAPLEPEPEPETFEQVPQNQGLFTPPSSQEQSPEKTWNDGFDFTAGHSIMVSNSPVLQVRKIDEIREIEEQLKREEMEEPEWKELEQEEPEQEERRIEQPEQKAEDLGEPEHKAEKQEEPKQKEEEPEEPEEKDEMRDILRRLSRVSMSPAPERTAEDPEDRITAEAMLFEPAEKSGPPSDDGDDNAEEPVTEGHLKPTLTTVAKDLRDLQIEAGIEDSLTVDDTKNNHIDILDAVDNDDSDFALSITEQERRLERMFLARMEQRLRNTSTSLRDTRHGIERLEKEVSSRESGQEESGYIHIHIKFPAPNWKFESPREAGNLFWLLLIMMILFTVWYVTESVTCHFYCKPMYSSYGGWTPSDPVFPWALPTKLFQVWRNIGGDL